LASTEAIRCENLTKRFGAFTAVDDLTLTIEEGASFGFLGPNGAGKTTTLRLFTGLTSPSQGRMWVGGEDVSGQSLDLRSQVGYLPESPAFYGWMTGREFLEFTADLYGIPRGQARSRAAELLKEVDLVDAADRKVRGYSRGMQQRLGLAQALVHYPRVLFLDEPASALDPMGRRDMLETINSLRGRTTVFISSHILADVERICDRVAIVNRGKLVALGSIDDLRRQQGSSVFLVQVEEDPAELVSQISRASWVSAVESASTEQLHALRVEASDLDTAKTQLPRLVYESGLTMLKYELMSASLEDVFMDVVGTGGGA
jgi:ABC-2 type transport system ATP-binding protein